MSYLTLLDVLTIHADQIERFGGTSGTRDLGLLDSALRRPQSGYYADVIEQATALWESLSQNHPFVDGNKRTAFAAMHVFLNLNGFEIVSYPQAVAQDIVAMYEGGLFEFKQLDSWLRRNTAKL